MADTSLAEALTLFTKVNVSMLKRIETLEKKGTTNKYLTPKDKPDKPESVVEEAQPTEVESFGRKALEDLGKILKTGATPTKQKEEIKKSKGFDDSMWDFFKTGSTITALGFILQNLLEDFRKGETGAVNAVVKTVQLAVEGLLKATEKTVEKILSSTQGKLNAMAAEKAAKPPKPPPEPTGWREKMASKEAKALQARVAASNQLKAAGFDPNYRGVEQGKPGAGSSKFQLKATLADFEKVNLPEPKVAPVGPAKPSLYQRMKGAAGSAWETTKEFGTSVKEKALERVNKVLAPIQKIFQSTPMKVIRGVMKIPGIFDAVFGYIDMRKAVTEFEQGKITRDELSVRLAQSFGGAFGSAGGGLLLGKALGTAGALAGTALGPVGTAIGAFGGGALGTLAGSYAGDKIGRMIVNGFAEASPQTTKQLGDYLGNLLLESRINEATANRVEQKQEENEVEIDDGIITKHGKIVIPNAEDSIYAMKSDGPFEKFFQNNTKVLEKTNTLLESLNENNDKQMNYHSELLIETNQLLTQMMAKLQQVTVNRANIVNNNYNDGVTLRGLQAVVS
jgi:hypothetical protein